MKMNQVDEDEPDTKSKKMNQVDEDEPGTEIERHGEDEARNLI